MVDKKLKYYLERKEVIERYFRGGQFVDAEREVLRLKKDMEGFAADILMNFTDEDQVVHEVITAENEMFPQVLGQHQNPGHTIEDVWFLLDAAEICDKPAWKKQIYMMAKKALRNGWDEEYGGLLHFCGIDGGEPEGVHREMGGRCQGDAGV